MKKEVKCYRCKENVVKDDAVKETGGDKKKYNKYFHDTCYKEHKYAREEYEKQDEVCQYVKKEILGYDDSQKINKRLVNRIQGLRSGQHLPKRNSKVYNSENGYDYETILMTFKVKKPDILYALQNTKFKDENHKHDYIMVIIENSINDVYMRIKEKEDSNKKVEAIKIEYDDSKYKYKNNPNKENKVADKLSHLW